MWCYAISIASILVLIPTKLSNQGHQFFQTSADSTLSVQINNLSFTETNIASGISHGHQH